LPPEPNLVIKSEFSRLMHVKPSAVSNWISRGQLTAPALKPDGRIDIELARQQLGDTVDPGRSHHRSSRPPAGTEAGTAAERAKLRRLKIYQLELEIAKRRRAAAAECASLVRADGAAAAWAVEFSALLIAIEEWLPDLAQMLGADREQILVAWNAFRQRLADQREGR
jgi:hypothetical protein